MVDEIREVEMELRRLREDAEHYKRESDSLKKEKKTVEAKNEYLMNKLKEASYVYGEAGKRLLYFINNQVNPVSKRLTDLEKDDKKLASQNKAVNDSVISMESLMKSDLSKFDKRLLALDTEIKDTQDKVQRAIKAAVRRAEKGDAETDLKMGKAVADLNDAISASKAASDKSTVARLTALDRKLSIKLGTLRDRSLLLGKDIEALRKFEGDIQGLEGKLQATVANLTQTRLDTEKLTQKLRGEMAATKGTIAKDMEKLSRDVERSIMEISSELRQADQKNLGILKLEVEKGREDMTAAVDAVRADAASFEKSMDARFRKAQSVLNMDIKDHAAGVDKRMKILEGNLSAASVAQKEAERIFNGKIEDIIRHDTAVDERIDAVDSGLMDHMTNFREVTKRKEILLKNELQRMSKAVDGKLKGLDTSVDKRISLMAKDIQHLKDIEVQIGAIATEVTKRREESAALSSRLNAMAKEVVVKSEKEDTRIRKELELLENDIRNRLETAESRIIKDNIKSFSAARNALRKDVHALREENAALKADVKNLKTMGTILSDLQQGVMGMEKKIADSSAEMKQLSAAVRSDIEKQTLRASKDLQGMSAKMMSDLDGVIARERERFASQSTELDTRYKELAKATTEVKTSSAQNSRSATSNAKNLVLLERKMDRLLKEVVGMKKEYKLEMGKLLKELEG